MRRRFATCVLVLLMSAAAVVVTAQAADTGEEEDFFDSTTVEAPKDKAEVKNLQEDLDKERLGLSGNLQGNSTYTLTRDFVNGKTGASDNSLSHAMTGDFLIDARLTKGYRAFVDLNLGYLTNGAPVVHDFDLISGGTIPAGTPIVVSEDQTTLFGVKEIFIDFNVSNAVYFRAGKQVLQWGRGYFWNPTDLINVERKSFTDMTALREGTFGLRADAVFSREFHLYTFLNFNGVKDISNVAYAVRAEFLVGSTEFGVSGWFKNRKIPVFGADVSCPLFWKISLTGEAAFSWGDNQDKLGSDGLPYSVRDRLVTKASVGLSRSFDAADVLDRINVITEFFYNDSGYTRDMFDSPSTLPIFVASYFNPGYYGKYYAALFVTVNKFPISDMTLGLNCLSNLSDMSAIAFTQLSYVPVNNFTLTFQLGAYLGEDNREYTVSYNSSTGELTNNMFFASLGAKVDF